MIPAVRFKKFLNTQGLLRRLDASTWRVLGRVGGRIMRYARKILHKRPGPSKPGQPPHTHKGQLRRFLLFGVDRRTRSVVIGPKGLGRAVVPQLLEEGGIAPQARKRKGQQKAPRRGTIEPRPYMGPAFRAVRPELPTFWRDAARR